MADKKKAYRIYQVSAKQFILDVETEAQMIKFSDYTNDRHWNKSSNILTTLLDTQIGHLYIYSKCENGTNNIDIVVSGTELTDDASYTYFLLHEGNRNDIDKAFIPTLNYSDFTVTFDEIDRLDENKADKVTGGTNGNFAGLDADGNLTDSGNKPADYYTQSDVNTNFYNKTEVDNIANTKSDKVGGAVAGNFAGLDTDGNLTDSGNKPADYYTQTEIDNIASGKTDKISGGVENNFVSIDASGNIKDSGKSGDDYVYNDLDDIPDGTAYKRVASNQTAPAINFNSNQLSLSFGDNMYGLGGDCKVVTGDWNNVLNSGFYIGNSLTNSPISAWVFMIVLRHNERYIKQIAYELSGSDERIWMRSNINDVWSSWVNLPSKVDGTTIENINGEVRLVKKLKKAVLRQNTSSSWSVLSDPDNIIFNVSFNSNYVGISFNSSNLPSNWYPDFKFQSIFSSNSYFNMLAGSAFSSSGQFPVVGYDFQANVSPAQLSIYVGSTTSGIDNLVFNNAGASPNQNKIFIEIIEEE